MSIFLQSVTCYRFSVSFIFSLVLIPLTSHPLTFQFTFTVTFRSLAFSLLSSIISLLSSLFSLLSSYTLTSSLLLSSTSPPEYSPSKFHTHRWREVIYNMNVLLDLRAASNRPIHKDEIRRLNFFIMAQVRLLCVTFCYVWLYCIVFYCVLLYFITFYHYVVLYVTLHCLLL